MAEKCKRRSGEDRGKGGKGEKQEGGRKNEYNIYELLWATVLNILIQNELPGNLLIANVCKPHPNISLFVVTNLVWITLKVVKLKKKIKGMFNTYPYKIYPN